MTVYLDIKPASKAKRSEGLDILARLIARNIKAERPPQPKRSSDVAT